MRDIVTSNFLEVNHSFLVGYSLIFLPISPSLGMFVVVFFFLGEHIQLPACDQIRRIWGGKVFGAGAFPKPTQGSQSPPSKSSLLDLPTIHVPGGHILGVPAPFPSCAGAGWRSRAAFGGSVGFCGSAVPWGVTPGPSAVPVG